jgi:2-amino-4-hydroxy-6-hydroxymethyldihydropteridine diphosphokinase
MDYYLNIGSNMGERRDNLYRAVVALTAGTGGSVTSRIVESEPWGFESDNRFMNIGLWFNSDLEPQQMLDRIHDIEHRLGSASHRDDQGGYIDRLVDIDIVAIGDLIIDTPTLQVPHPHLSEREFFLKPMMDLAPNWCHPVTGLTAAQMLEGLENKV